MADVEPVNDINENVEDEQNCVPARQQGKREQQSESGNQVIDYPFGQMGFGFYNNRSQNRKGKIEKKQRPVSAGRLKGILIVMIKSQIDFLEYLQSIVIKI